jgi:hypothetical protein
MRGEPVPPVPVQRSLLAQRPQRKNEIAEQVSHLRRGLGPTVGGLGTKPRSGAKSSAPVLGAEARNLCDLIDSAISALTKRSCHIRSRTNFTSTLIACIPGHAHLSPAPAIRPDATGGQLMIDAQDIAQR